MKDFIFKLIDQFTEGVDTYHNNGSMWLIFTDEKKWVIELTKEGTLWYNHYFFQDCFKYLSLDSVENQHYITEWVESIIQNGVKDTGRRGLPPPPLVEDIIQNGIKDVIGQIIDAPELVNDAIQNGVIDTFGVDVDLNHLVEDTIQNGVRNTFYVLSHDLGFVEDIIQNGVKRTEAGGYLGSIEMKGKIVHQLESPKQNEEVEDVIKNGIKETKSLEHDRTTYHGYFNQDRGSHTPLDKVQDVIENGIKETKWRTVDNFPEFEERVIQNGIKETWGYERQPQQRVEQVIEQGTKENPSL